MRQYIGARYTTKIYENSLDPGSCEWESGVVYEPLTIVSYQNSSYLSRTTVPANAGAPTVATQYWAQTGFYNGQIAQLQQDVSDINDDLITVHSDITGLKKGYPRIMGKKIGVYADSYGASYPEWIYQMNRNLGGGYFNKSYGGYTMEAIYTYLVASDTEEADIYIICGGINDWNSQTKLSTTIQACRNIINALRTRSPEAEIYFIVPPTGATHSLDAPTENLNIVLYRQIIGSCTRSKVGVIDLNCVNGFKFGDDGLHPYSTDNSVLDLMGDAFCEMIENYGTNIGSETGISDSTGLGYCVVNGNHVHYWPTSITFENGNAVLFSQIGYNCFEAVSIPCVVPISGKFVHGYAKPVDNTHCQIELLETGYTGTYSGTVPTYGTTDVQFIAKQNAATH